MRNSAILLVLSSLPLVGCGGRLHITNDSEDAAGGTSTGDASVGDSSVGETSIEPVDLGVPADGGKPSSCPPGTKTTLRGTVRAPNGKWPIHNAIVYVPTTSVAPLTAGVTCDRCGAVPSGNPKATTLTDAKGAFVLDGVPDGSDIPLVIQIGKWRRITKIPKITACVANELTDPELTRLPKSRSEGDMPKIAVTLGGCDKIACLLPKLGISSEEYGVDGTSKAIHFYKPEGGVGMIDGPPGMKDARVLWDDPTKLKEYDLAIFSCECSEAPTTKTATSFAAVDAYLAAGGRILTTDFQYLWYKQSPDAAMRSAVTIPGGAPSGNNPVTLDTTFPKGKALSDWLATVRPSAPAGTVQFDYVFNNLSAADPTKSQTWASSVGLSGGAGTTNNPRIVTINTPVGKPAAAQCGKALHLDVHTNQSDTIGASFPAGCTSATNAGQEVAAFMFFDLSSCIQNDSAAPTPPPVK